MRFVDDWDLILMEAVSGDRFKDALKASETEEEMSQGARTAAKGLAAFQRLRVETEESRTLPGWDGRVRELIRLACPEAERSARA